MAFVDSKLAEMRATAASNIPSADAQIAADASSHEAGQAAVMAANAMTIERAQQRRQQQNARQSRPSRRGPARGPQDIERDSLIESIMRESADVSTPLYDLATATSSAQNLDDDDAEEAAAEAFKAQFMQDMEADRRRRPPAQTPFSKVAEAKGKERTAHGPKLGGSRQQRERMKRAQAAEEAAEKAKK